MLTCCISYPEGMRFSPAAEGAREAVFVAVPCLLGDFALERMSSSFDRPDVLRFALLFSLLSCTIPRAWAASDYIKY